MHIAPQSTPSNNSTELGPHIAQSYAGMSLFNSNDAETDFPGRGPHIPHGFLHCERCSRQQEQFVNISCIIENKKVLLLLLLLQGTHKPNNYALRHALRATTTKRFSTSNLKAGPQDAHLQ